MERTTMATVVTLLGLDLAMLTTRISTAQLLDSMEGSQGGSGHAGDQRVLTGELLLREQRGRTGGRDPGGLGLGLTRGNAEALM